MKNEKTRGERGAYSHYILVMAVAVGTVLRACIRVARRVPYRFGIPCD